MQAKAECSICPQKSWVLVLVRRQRLKIDHLIEKGRSILVHKFSSLRPQSLGLVALGLWQKVLKACLLHDKEAKKGTHRKGSESRRFLQGHAPDYLTSFH